MTGPDPNKVYPNENIRQVVFIKNVVKRANIVVGDYTYYDDPDGISSELKMVGLGRREDFPQYGSPV